MAASDDSFALAFEEDVVSAAGVQYRTLQQLGIGGNAATYLMMATNGPLRGLSFAVKFFRRLSRPEWRAGFDQEANFLQSCAHPAIMRYYDRGVARESNPFFVAEYLPETLATLMHAGKLTVVDKLHFSTQLLSALAFLADRQPPALHRDIKPDNLFVKGRSCVLGDFGLMKFVADADGDGSLLKQSLGPGMPHRYRTPDLVAYLRGEGLPTAKSDVYQLGLVLAELFCGENPQEQSANGDFRSPVVLRLECLNRIPGEMAPQVRNLLRGMLTEDPGQRPAARELLEPWVGLFFEAATRVHGLDGRVFSP